MKRRPFSLAVVLASVACTGQTSGIGQMASKQLTPEVQQIRAAAASGDAAATGAKLADLRRTVADLRQQGQLTEAGASNILAAAADVAAGTGAGGAAGQTPPPLSSSPHARTTTTSTRSGSSDTQPAPTGKDKGKGGDHGGQRD